MRRVVVLLAVVGLAGCGVGSRNFRGAAEDVIEDDERTAANFEGRTFDDAQCEEPEDQEEGSTFICLATDNTGAPVSFVVTILSDDEFTVSAPQEGSTPTTVAPSVTTTVAPAVTTTVAPAVTTTVAPPST